MTLDRSRPEILHPPQHPQACCTQQTITVPADVNAKTRQKHDYPSAAWRRSYARRTGAERGFATAKDPATNDITRGWCRLMGLTPPPYSFSPMLFCAVSSTTPLANHVYHFPLLFYHICPAALASCPPVAGSRPPAPRGGSGISSSGTRCAPRFPGRGG